MHQHAPAEIDGALQAGRHILDLDVGHPLEREAGELGRALAEPADGQTYVSSSDPRATWLLRRFGLSTLRRYLGRSEAAYRQLYEGDDLTRAAASVFEQIADDPRRRDVLYTVFGHTLHAAQIPIGQGRDVDWRPRAYLNAGTWRALAQLGVTGSGFMSWSDLNLTVLYNPDHDPDSRAGQAGYPTFETWSGSLLDPGLHVIP